MMDWNMYAFWNHCHWTGILLVTVVALSIAIVMILERKGKGLFSRKPEVSKEIHDTEAMKEKDGGEDE